ncbi:hypothetical protein TWF730_008710 [Orbilia blumenaviensis]|uniref:Coenzyme Q-binding protein COQ10 START domain-containing protein n=1 Tax=Orbilia blumenaviensis TaxID=1796055 RepID=A0AAV9V3V1_9PEZI
MIVRPPPSLSLRLVSSASHSRAFKPASQTRHFILPTSRQRFTATRTLAHPPSKLFTLISDINSYSSFVPFCLSSTVTSVSPPPESYPTTADLRVGWGGFDETFTSRVKCEKFTGKEGGLVEADATQNGIFEVLKATWVINNHDNKGSSSETRRDGDGESKVDLEIEYKFANPLYAVMSEAVMPTVAGKIIEAFEGRVEKVLGKK